MRSTSQGENVEEFRLFIGYWAAVDTVAAGLTGVSRQQTESHNQVLVHSRETSHSAEGRGKTMAMQSSNSVGAKWANLFNEIPAPK
jgi:ornithine cyclodeaminase/alanine dehydrogenase-like protein (mu-crystallin family)